MENVIKGPRMAILSLIAIIITCCVMYCSKSKQASRDSESSNAYRIILTDSISKIKTSLGIEKASKQSIESDYEVFKSLSARQISELQKIVSKHTQSATEVGMKTTDSSTTRTVVEYIHDTINGNSSAVYKTEWCDTNSCGSIRATRDSVYRNIQIFNHLFIKQDWSGKWYQRKSLITTVENRNPNTTTTKIQSYTKAAPKQRRPMWVAIGAALMTILVVAVK
jgi:hypothetical protein